MSPSLMEEQPEEERHLYQQRQQDEGHHFFVKTLSFGSGRPLHDVRVRRRNAEGKGRQAVGRQVDIQDRSGQERQYSGPIIRTPADHGNLGDVGPQAGR